MNVNEGLLKGIEQFCVFIELEKGLASNTTSSYEADLMQFASFLTNNKVPDWLKVDSAHLSFWISELTSNGYEVSSLMRKVTSVRMLAKFLVTEGIRQDNFAQNISQAKRTRKLPDTLTQTQVSDLLNLPDLSNPRGLRDRALLELLYSSGLRVSEISSLELTSIDLQEGYLRVTGKGSKERIVPIGQQAIHALSTYLLEGRPALTKAKTGSAVFISQQGKPISRKTIWLLLRNYGKQLGLMKPVKPHMLRHCFATHLLSNGADLRVIQEMLGHADISTTQIYTAVETQRALDEYSRCHPREMGL